MNNNLYKTLEKYLNNKRSEPITISNRDFNTFRMDNSKAIDNKEMIEYDGGYYLTLNHSILGKLDNNRLA